MYHVPSTDRVAELISRGRATALGFATISILLFHQHYVTNGFFWETFKRHGYWGVELFLFLSGFGIYYSLAKCDNTKTFYQKRFGRIMPTVFLNGLLMTILSPLFPQGLISGYLPYGLNYVSVLTGMNFWYIRAILIYYLLSPFLYKRLNQPIFLLLLFVGSYAAAWLCYIFLPQHGDPGIHKLLIWPFGRFSSYILGMVTAHGLCKGISPLTVITTGVVFLCIALLVTSGPLCPTEFLFLPMAALGVCVCFGKWSEFVASTPFTLLKKMDEALRYTGTLSLEIYISHLSVMSALNSMGFHQYRCTLLLLAVLTLLISGLLHLAAKQFLACVPVCFKRNKKHQTGE